MQKRIKLYDFSIGNAVLVVLAYLCLLCVLAGAGAGASNPLPFLIAILLLVITFVAIFWRFVGYALTLDASGAHKGKKTLAKQGVHCTVFYNTRYREMTLRFENGGESLCVQATKRNVAKAEAWLCCKLEIPQKPGRFGKGGAA